MSQRYVAVRAAGQRLIRSAVQAYPNFPANFGEQVRGEVGGALTSNVRMFGFFGGICNWFLGFAAVSDALQKGPEVISLPMTVMMLCYSALFARWAGWAVAPRNYILCGSHIFNVMAQSNQLRRVVTHKLKTGGESAKREIAELGQKAVVSALILAAAISTSEQLQALVAPIGPAFLSSPAGPFTIHFWPPLLKLALSLTSLMELNRPTDKISLSQYSALTVTGAIFSCYGLVVSPVNYSLAFVNVLLFFSSFWHLGRKVRADYL